MSGDRDPTTWLPDELMIRILLLVPLKSLLTRQCAGVCRRWRALVKMGPVDRRRRGGRWVGYAEGWVKPRLLHLGHTAQVLAVAVGPTGNLYAGSEDGTMRVWDHVHATLIRTLVGHAEAVYALAVSRTDVVYSGSDDTTIQVWSGGMAPTSAPSSAIRGPSRPSLSGSRTRSTLGRVTRLCGCGRPAMGPSCRSWKGTRVGSALF